MSSWGFGFQDKFENGAAVESMYVFAGSRVLDRGYSYRHTAIGWADSLHTPHTIPVCVQTGQYEQQGPKCCTNGADRPTLQLLAAPLPKKLRMLPADEEDAPRALLFAACRGSLAAPCSGKQSRHGSRMLAAECGIQAGRTTQDASILAGCAAARAPSSPVCLSR